MAQISTIGVAETLETAGRRKVQAQGMASMEHDAAGRGRSTASGGMALGQALARQELLLVMVFSGSAPAGTMK